MLKALQFTGFMASMTLGVLVSFVPIGGSISQPGGQGVDCDVDFKANAQCPNARPGNVCNGKLDQAGNGAPNEKLSQTPATGNCSNFFDNQGFVCANVAEVRILADYNCALAPPPPPEPL